MRFIDTAELSEHCDASIWCGRRHVEENGKIVVTRVKLAYISLSIFMLPTAECLALAPPMNSEGSQAVFATGDALELIQH